MSSEMPECKHCGEVIRWNETFGWIHGMLGDGWKRDCADGKHKAEADAEWLKWMG